MQKYVLGVDIGGTNIEFGIVDSNGTIIEHSSFPTSSIKDIKELPKKIQEALTHQVSGIGIGAPSSNFYTGMIEYAPNLNWGENIPLRDYFENTFACKTVVTNDANAAAIGEKKFGAAKNIEHFVEITLGTGLGSGVVINNQIVYGKNGTAGEYGHISIDAKGRNCGCGRKGCLETYCSATGMLKSAKKLEHPSKVNSPLNKESNYNCERIFELAEKKDEFSSLIVEYTAEKLGFALANFAAFSNPEAFILFGGIARNGEYFRSRVQYYLDKNILNLYAGKTKVITSLLHNKNAAILGAASLID